MITCPDCSRPCSELAQVCPNCGRPLSRGSLLTKNLGFGAVVYTVMLVSGMILVGAFDVAGLGWLLIVMGGLLLIARLRFSK